MQILSHYKLNFHTYAGDHSLKNLWAEMCIRDRHYPILIAGHTHRPVFSQPGEGSYFNTGSCVHPRCITGIEIENNHITLIKWSVRSGRDRYLSVEREILEGPVPISDYFKK